MPVTTPVEPTVTLELLATQPPKPASASVVTDPSHTLAVPVIAGAAGFTVNDLVTVQPLPSE
jgi:hypothetical protein